MQLKDLLARVRQLDKKHVIASALLGVLAIAFLLGLFAFRGALFDRGADPSQPPVTPAAGDEREPLAFRHPLTGAPEAEERETLPRVFSVMVDHAADAWPQSGVDGAFLVIEAPVEASIPRLQAFFSEEVDAEKIGPVRSARPYFVDWASGFGALYAHVGGSDDALRKINNGAGVVDLNQFSNGASFWRSADRYAPINVYTSMDLLRAAFDRLVQARRAPEAVEYGTWTFKDHAEGEDRPEAGVSPTVDFSSSTYRVRWAYDPATNLYRRYQGPSVYALQDGAEIQAANVAVVVTDMRVLDAVGRREIRTLGEGEAVLFQDGRAVDAMWKKESAGERLRFYDEDGEELAFNPGLTWIEVVSNRDAVRTE